MKLFKFTRRETPQGEWPTFHEMTFIRSWGREAFRICDATAGVIILGATGSGKTSGPGRHTAYGYLSAGFGGLILCSKPEERSQWERWARDTGRSDDLVIIDKDGDHRFNFLDWESSRIGSGAGLTLNVVALLDEVAGAISGDVGKADSGGTHQFFKQALHQLFVSLVDLPILAGLEVSLLLLRSILNSAPLTPEQIENQDWQAQSACFAILREADHATLLANADIRASFEECRAYWLIEFPNLSERTRSIITLSFSMLVRPFITHPLRRLFSTDTNITPEATFDGRIIIVDLPIQEFRQVGRICQLVWKYCFQVAVLRRVKPEGGHLRPVFLWADECQNIVSEFDSEYQAVARSAGGATVYLTQNRESLIRVLGSEPAVASLLANLQTKIFCQNAGETNEWASKLLGDRYVNVTGTNVGNGDKDHHHAGVSTNEQHRRYVEPSAFTTLKRGGEVYGRQVEAIVYKGGTLFTSSTGELLPYKLLTFMQ